MDPYPPMYSQLQDLYVPPRYSAPSEGRNSITYSQLPPLYDTTKIYLIDNKSADISSLNYQNDHSNFLTSVVQNSDYSPMEAATQTIKFDDRSRWGADFKSILYMNIPNITEYMFSNSFRAKLMISKKNNIPIYDWVTLTIPEGNFSVMKVIDLMNNAIVEHYLSGPRNNEVLEEDIGLKFDTRNFMLGYDPVSKLVMPGVYTYEAFHPDFILLPGCAIDFTFSRLNNLLGIRKRLPFQEGFIITYEDLKGGNIPGLLDLAVYKDGKGEIEVVKKDLKDRKYHVDEDKTVEPTFTSYRSWFIAYNYGEKDGIKSKTLLTNPDVTCGVEQIYWSLPDLACEPVTFKASYNVNNYPVIGTEVLPLHSRSFFNAQAVYSQIVSERTNQTHVFNRFPENQILVRPPAPTISSISENVPAVTDHGVVPIKNTVAGVQRVTVTDARRRICPYVYKSVGVLTPKVLSSRTL
ncbi:penton base protein [Mastadenovirus eidoli]|uniref:Penton protein n=1 Tax=Eidolon helvum adenovirus TaxID=2039267 RepID=A0A348FKG3_9ADEN|nr:penton base protein [Eidolon helvum adenovirus]BBF72830.1 penton base protein [Eidolon helvum adenovirus]